LVTLAFLSLIAFGVEDIAAYFGAMAFSGDHVRLHVDFSILLMGVCGSYIARFIPLTPGGYGQFELGFATSLYVAGVGLPEAVTIAFLDNMLRYTGFIQLYLVMIQIPTRPWPEASYSQVLGTFKGALSIHEPALVLAANTTG